MNTNIDNAMNDYFRQLNIDPMEFLFDDKKSRFISKHSFEYDSDDPEEYFIVVKMNVNNSIGTVVIGTSDGIRFNETDLLGQIVFDGTKWINL